MFHHFTILNYVSQMVNQHDALFRRNFLRCAKLRTAQLLRCFADDFVLEEGRKSTAKEMRVPQKKEWKQVIEH